MEVLKVSGVEFAYRKGRSVLNGCSLSLKKGEIQALLGCNGAGKSTLLSIAIGWLIPQSGEVLLKGTPIHDLPTGALGRLIGLVPQVERLPFNFTVLDYVLMGRVPYLIPLESPGERERDLAVEALRLTGMEDWMYRGIRNLSSGEMQLVSLARTLCQETEILLMDEPTSALDLRHKGRLVDLIGRLAEERGTSVLFTSQEPQFVSHLATSTSLMAGGRILASGETREMLRGELLSQVYHHPIRVDWVGGVPVIGYYSR